MGAGVRNGTTGGGGGSGGGAVNPGGDVGVAGGGAVVSAMSEKIFWEITPSVRSCKVFMHIEI